MYNTREKESQLLEQEYLWVDDKSLLGLDIDARNGESEFIVFLFLIGSIIPNGNSIWDFIRPGTLNNHNSPCSDSIICEKTSGYDSTFYVSLHRKCCKVKTQRPDSDQKFLSYVIKINIHKSL